jgi:hypothetical protein
MLPLEKQTTEPGLRDNGFVLGDSYKKSLVNPRSFGWSSQDFVDTQISIALPLPQTARG